MPASRDPAAARQRILEAAAQEFARHGFAGARVDRVAAVAGLNKRMLYHYYGDKAGLVRAVLGGPLAALDGATPLNGEAARLLLWALLDPGTAAETAARVRGVGAQDGTRRLADLLAALDLGLASPDDHPRAGEPPASASPARRPTKVRVRLKRRRLA